MKKLGTKISLQVILLVAAVMLLGFLLVQRGFTKIIDDLLAQQSDMANSSLHRELSEYLLSAKLQAQVLAQEDLSGYISPGRKDPAVDFSQLISGADFVTICDAEGIVRYRSHSAQTGDKLAEPWVVEDILTEGKTLSGYEIGDAVPLAIQGGSPVRGDTGEIIGAVFCGYDISQQSFLDELKEKYHCDISLFIGNIRYNTTLVDESGARQIGKPVGEEIAQIVLQEGREYTGRVDLYGSPYVARYSPVLVKGESIGIIFSGINITDVERQVWNTVLVMGLSLLVIILMAFFVIHYIAKVSISRPLEQIGLLADRLKRGDIGVQSGAPLTIAVSSKDEVGQLARTLEDAGSSLQGYVHEIHRQMQRLSEGQLDEYCEYPFQGDFVDVRRSINSIIRQFNETLRQIQTASSQVMLGAEEMSTISQSVAGSSNQQAAALATLIRQTDHVRQKAEELAKQASNAHHWTQLAKGSIADTNAMLDNVTHSVDDISHSFENITRIMDDIQSIAFQTHILSLNASVEAARAGSQGKGFAVVAEEVSKLAHDSSNASEQTSILIENAGHAVSASLVPTKEILAAIHSNDEQASKVAEGLLAVKDDITSQSAMIREMYDYTDSISQGIHENSSSSQVCAATSRELAAQAESLHQMILSFQLMPEAHYSVEAYHSVETLKEA